MNLRLINSTFEDTSMNTILSIGLNVNGYEHPDQLTDTLRTAGFLGGYRKQGLPAHRWALGSSEWEGEAERFVQVSLPGEPTNQSIAACARVLGQTCIARLNGDRWDLIYAEDARVEAGGTVAEYPVIVAAGLAA